jgi:hypothetical protein
MKLLMAVIFFVLPAIASAYELSCRTKNLASGELMGNLTKIFRLDQVQKELKYSDEYFQHSILFEQIDNTVVITQRLETDYGLVYAKDSFGLDALSVKQELKNLSNSSQALGLDTLYTFCTIAP